jgi:hypothetical protein
MPRALTAGVLAVALVGCSVVAGELDRGAAIAAARAHIGDPVDAVVSAVWTPTLPDGRAPQPPDRGVWTIEFRASFERPCGPAPGDGGPPQQCRVERIVIRIGSTTGSDLGRDEEGRVLT